MRHLTILLTIVFAPLSLADGVTKERLPNGKIITIYSDDPDVIAARIRKEETKIEEQNEAWATLREIEAERQRLLQSAIYQNCLIDLMPQQPVPELRKAVLYKCKQINNSPTLWQRYKYGE